LSEPEYQALRALRRRGYKIEAWARGLLLEDLRRMGIAIEPVTNGNQLSLLDADPTSGARFSNDRKYRYRLWRSWARGPRLVFCMLNPSIASEESDDLTVRKCIGFARALGYGGIEIVNLYDRIATLPADLWAMAEDERLTALGQIALTDAMRGSLRDGVPFVVAWGVVPFEARARVQEVLRLYSIIAGEAFVGAPFFGPHCLGQTAAGHPRHPSRLGYSAALVKFDPSRVRFNAATLEGDL